jgi:hypothetical protein
MAVTPLSRVITESFVKTLTKVGSSSAQSTSTASGTSFGQKSEVSLSAGLRSGARDFSASVQLLNNGISVIIVKDAARGSISAGKARRLRTSFGDIARDFEKLLAKTAEEKLDVLNPDDLAGVLSRAGLDVDTVGEISGAFRKLTSLSDASVDSAGNVISSANMIPADDFYRALKQSIVDLDDPMAEEAGGGFTGVRSKVAKLRSLLEGNIKGLDETAEVVGKNLELVRVVGLAMLDLSASLPGSATAATVAEDLQTRIRQGAPLLLGQAHNLQSIVVAGLSEINASSGKQND